MALEGLARRRERCHARAPLRLVAPFRVEDLHARILAVGDVDVAVGVERDRVRDAELARAVAGRAPLAQKLAAVAEDGDARVALRARRSERVASSAWRG
eukprot:6535850-Prymnesium_polylepis.1